MVDNVQKNILKGNGNYVDNVPSTPVALLTMCRKVSPRALATTLIMLLAIQYRYWQHAEKCPQGQWSLCW
jgi:hypothetical protein